MEAALRSQLIRILDDAHSQSELEMITPYVTLTDPQGEQQVYVLSADEIVVGRKSDVDIILRDPSVSRHHAKLIKSCDGYAILDLPNTRGTYVNGSQVTQQKLQHGDRIRLAEARTEICYYTREEDVPQPTHGSGADKPANSLADLSSVLPSTHLKHSDLEKMSSLLDFQYQLGQTFSAEKSFDQILAAALKISGAERGYILLKRQERLEYVSGLSQNGRRFPESEFHASQSVARQVALDGQPVYTMEELDNKFAQQQSIVALRIRSLACMPLRWLSPDSVAPTVNGVLYLDSTQMIGALSALDRKMLDKLAGEASNVFEKLELVRTFEQRKTLELELALAQSELQAAEALHKAEEKVLLAEYGASMGRFAAALSHELNSPMGALKTALQTSAALKTKKLLLPPEKQKELEEIDADLRRTALESLERLHQIVLRMQRFTNLDRSELLQVDLNALLRDVVDFIGAELKAGVSIEVTSQPLPSIFVRPQQISAVFSNLLQNAIDGLEGGGHVMLTTRRRGSQVEVCIEDDGKGMPPEELANIFDPAFKIKSGRVSTGNWSLFSSRQIVWQHGGEIAIQSTLGKGTHLRVVLPFSETD
jgi:signal transduction histidine kinase